MPEWVSNSDGLKTNKGESQLKNANLGSQSAIFKRRLSEDLRTFARLLVCFATACSAVAASTIWAPLWAQAFPNKRATLHDRAVFIVRAESEGELIS